MAAAAAAKRRRRMSWRESVAVLLMLLSVATAEEAGDKNQTSAGAGAIRPKKAINLIQHFDGLSDEKSEEKPGNLSWGPPSTKFSRI